MAKKIPTMAEWKKMSAAQKKAYFEKNVKPNMLEGGVGGVKSAAVKVVKAALSKKPAGNTAAPIKAEIRTVKGSSPMSRATSKERAAERKLASERSAWKSYEPPKSPRRSEGAKKAAATAAARRAQRLKNAEAKGMAKGAAITSTPFLIAGATKKSGKKK